MVIEVKGRSRKVFGREVVLRRLTDRARERGLTALVGRPKMGKTWTLETLSVQLLEEGGFLIGYHDYRGGESSHLLYAVRDLYAGWLGDSTLREQAVSLWVRNRPHLISRVGRLASGLFASLGEAFPGGKGVGDLVHKAFDALIVGAEDLKSGGLSLAPLAYDEARDLVRLVAEISGKVPILILDGCEKSEFRRREFMLLESFLNNPEEWGNTHIFLGIRAPELGAGSSRDEENALQSARTLSILSSDALVLELPPLDLPPQEAEQLCHYLRSSVNATREVPDSLLIQMIGGNPAVLSDWLSPATRTRMATEKDLRERALASQDLRYPEFDRLLPDLTENQQLFVQRLAALPRLSEERWKVLRPVIDGLKAVELDELLDRGILEQSEPASFGHDTRHTAVRRWLAGHRKNAFRECVALLLRTLAEKCVSADSVNETLVGSISAAADLEEFVPVDEQTLCLVSAVKAVEGNLNAKYSEIFERGYWDTAQHNPRVAFLVGAGLLTEALHAYRKTEINTALYKVTAALEMPNAPVLVMSNALFNRALLKKLQSDFSGAFADYTALAELPGVSTLYKVQALNNRGSLRDDNDTEGKMADFTSVIELKEGPVRQVSMALVNRADVQFGLGDLSAALSDWTAVTKLPPGTNPWALATAYLHLGVYEVNFQASISYYSQAAGVMDAPPDIIAHALFNRGVTYYKAGDKVSALRDYDAVIGMRDAPSRFATSAYLNKADLQGTQVLTEHQRTFIHQLYI